MLTKDEQKKRGIIMRHAWITLTVLLFLTIQIGCNSEENTENSLNGSEQSFNIDEAIEGLSSGQEANIRKSIKGISGNSKSENILNAIPPLTDILADETQNHDLATKAMVSSAISSISKGVDWDEADRMLVPVREQLYTGRSEFVRASAAKALGDSGWTQVKSDLIAAIKTDKSILVRTACENAINTLNQYQQAPVDQKELSMEEKTVNTVLTFNTSSSNSVHRDCMTEEEYDWIKKHILNFNTETMQIPICE
jgi:ABC-type phosphate/phosphonate transport system substrate-binding protein